MTLGNTPGSIQRRIIIGFSGLIFLFLGLMIIVELAGIPGTYYTGSFAQYRTDILKNMELASGLLVQRITTWISERRQDVEVLSRSPFLRQAIEVKTPLSRRELSREISQFLSINTEFESIALVDSQDGSILAASGNMGQAGTISNIQISPDQFSRFIIPGYRETIDFHSSFNVKGHLRIIRQVFSPSTPHRLVAILVAETNIEKTFRPILRSTPSLHSQDWECIVANKTISIITPTREKPSDSNSRPVPGNGFETFAPIRRAISGLDGPYEGPDPNGRPVLAFHRQIRIDRGLSLALVLQMDRRLALRPAWSALSHHMVLWVFMFLVGIGACIFLARKISQPLQELVAVARRIEAGDLTARAVAGNQLEIDLLATVFNSMVAQLQNWHQNLEQQILDRTSELKKSEEKFRVVFERSPIGLILVNSQCVVVDCNQNLADIFGVRREEYLGLNLLEKLPDGPVRQNLIDALADDEFHLYEGRHISFLSGKEMQISLSSEKVAPDLVISIVMDITKRMEAEEEIGRLNAELEQRVSERTVELEAAYRELEGFSYSISHDLRAPLRHLTGFVGLLKDQMAQDLDEKSRHYLEVISESAIRMSKLIDDILSFSRMGRVEMLRTPVNLGLLLEEIVNMIEPEVKHRDIHWTIGHLPQVQGDPALLKTVLENLILNAVKFTQKKAPAVIEVGCLSTQADEKILYVKDNGAGFDMEYSHKLFGLFQRLHYENEFEGTGLGLANVRRIIERHGGRVWAEGVVGEGACFYFSLPKG